MSTNKAKTFIGFIDNPIIKNNIDDEDDIYPYETKIGGQPIWCAQPPLQYRDMKCNECGSYLAFLLQAYCPLESLPDYERNFYVFFCANKCSSKVTGWKVIKCMDPLQESSVYDDEINNNGGISNGSTSEESPIGNKKEEEEEEEEDNNFVKEQDNGNGNNQDDDDDWGIDSKDEWGIKSNTTNFDVNNNNSNNNNINQLLKNRDKILQDQQKQKKEEKLELLCCRSDRVKDLRESFNSEATEEIISGVLVDNDPSNQIDPFYLYIEEERLKKLPQQQPKPNQTDIGKYNNMESAEEEGQWSNETYEYVKDRIFSKFLKRLSHNPDQILRYSFGGEPLCTSKQGVEENEKCHKCKKCGNNKVFEFQILSTIISQVYSKKQPLGSFDFGNIFIYSCPNHCFDKNDVFNDVVYIDESIIFESSI